MKIETKAQIAGATLSALTAVVSVVFLGVVVLVICAGLQINPFKETTTSFLVAAFVGLIGVATVLLFLNIATSVSLIADSKIVEVKSKSDQRFLGRWLAAFFVVAIILVGLIFIGTYLSREKYLGVVRAQADEVLSENKRLLEEISRLIGAGKPEDFKRVYDVQAFLQNQRSGLPNLTIIYAGKFTDKLALYQISNYFPGDSSKGTYDPVYFACTRNHDCDYLTKFFSGEGAEPLQKYTIRDDQFYIYIPFIANESRFVLLFDRRNAYGKLGS